MGEVRPQEAGPKKLHQSQRGGCLRPAPRDSRVAPARKISNLGACVSLLEPFRPLARDCSRELTRLWKAAVKKKTTNFHRGLKRTAS